MRLREDRHKNYIHTQESEHRRRLNDENCTDIKPNCELVPNIGLGEQFGR